MWATAVRNQGRRVALQQQWQQPWNSLGFLRGGGTQRPISSSSPAESRSLDESQRLLDLEEVEKVLSDVKASDVKVVPVRHRCSWTDFMVFATGRSTWHVRNIAQSLIYKVKQKQKEKGVERLLLPSVEGQQSGNWIVIDAGPVIVHALDEKARAYYNLERLWSQEMSAESPNQDLEKAFVKTRPKNNSKKRVLKTV